MKILAVLISILLLPSFAWSDDLVGKMLMCESKQLPNKRWRSVGNGGSIYTGLDGIVFTENETHIVNIYLKDGKTRLYVRSIRRPEATPDELRWSFMTLNRKTLLLRDNLGFEEKLFKEKMCEVFVDRNKLDIKMHSFRERVQAEWDSKFKGNKI